MRPLIITLALLVLAGAGGFFYWRANPEAFAPAPEVVAPPPPPEPPRAEMCSAQHGRYAHRRDPSLTLRLEQGPGQVMVSASAISDYSPGSLGERVFVVTTGDGREFRYAAASSLGYTLNYLFPLDGTQARIGRGVDLIQVSTFTTDMEYVPGLPRMEYAAPAHIYAPNLFRHLYAQGGNPRIAVPIDFFDFVSCAEPEAEAPAPQEQAAPAQ